MSRRATSSFLKPLLAATTAASVAVLSQTFLSAGTRASADPAPTPPSVTQLETGDYSGTVPDGVCAVRVEVLGGAGGSSISTNASNGAGARVAATYPVVPGQSYSGTVGGGGKRNTSPHEGSAGGFNGGGAGGTQIQQDDDVLLVLHQSLRLLDHHVRNLHSFELGILNLQMSIRYR